MASDLCVAFQSCSQCHRRCYHLHHHHRSLSIIVLYGHWLAALSRTEADKNIWCHLDVLIKILWISRSFALLLSLLLLLLKCFTIQMSPCDFQHRKEDRKRKKELWEHTESWMIAQLFIVYDQRCNNTINYIFRTFIFCLLF